MIFAAGFGTRMAPLTDTMPKPLIPVAGRPLLDYAVDIARPHRPVVLNAHYLGEQIVEYGRDHSIRVSYEPEILDTGGGLLAARHLFDETAVFTLNSDAIWVGPNPLDVLKENWTPDMDALLLCAEPTETQGDAGKGNFLISGDGTLTRGKGAIYLGAQIIRLSLLDDMPQGKFSIRGIWEMLAQQKKLRRCFYPGQWCDVGHPENIAVAERILKDGESV